MKTTQSPSPKRKAPRFGGAAKIAVSALAATTLLGGWNLIAHLDNAQADAKANNDGATTLLAPISSPMLAPLTIAPVPTLRPASNLALPSAAEIANPAVFTASKLPALAPLPTMASLPNLPPPPSAPSGGELNSRDGGNTSSGGS
jgi:hypothetical protein